METTYFTFENLYRAYSDCRKRKTKTLNHLRFAENLEDNLLSLESRLRKRTYKPGRSIVFVVKKPKLREIFAADFLAHAKWANSWSLTKKMRGNEFLSVSS